MPLGLPRLWYVKKETGQLKCKFQTLLPSRIRVSLMNCKNPRSLNFESLIQIARHPYPCRKERNGQMVMAFLTLLFYAVMPNPMNGRFGFVGCGLQMEKLLLRLIHDRTKWADGKSAWTLLQRADRLLEISRVKLPRRLI